MFRLARKTFFAKLLLSSSQISWTLEGARSHLQVKLIGESRRRFCAAMLQLHDAARPLTWLLGQWESIEAKGMYPTTKPFDYTETLNITHLGQPLLNFESETWREGEAKHVECGYIRIKPDTTRVAYICAQNIGMVEIEEGELDGTSIEFTTSSVLRTSFAREDGATGLKRSFRLDGDILEQIVYMSTAKTPMSKHLHIRYKKKEDAASS